ncbi:hypothetical protein TNIN_281321 [Trichonephila inaurata madagascariensis]|uniref:Uncharacterized protein n=1 Tax=Trichonephila inaurata madagascariensis TaxID=2747483 RepID=A0A8X6Y8P7_9ARAC|nr:hypothetical protein TNIN_281321 [Trichonephila inaurata madagascariensis]
MTEHENVKKDVLVFWPLKRQAQISKAARNSGTYTKKDHLSIARVELRLHIQFRVYGVKEGPPRHRSPQKKLSQNKQLDFAQTYLSDMPIAQDNKRTEL